jgi:hypothetical protein
MTEPSEGRLSPRSIEIVEVTMLALVAIATAWSGYQGTKWGGQQAILYGQASSTRFAADAASTLGGQELGADAAMFTSWLEAHQARNTELEDLLVRRFTPDYAAAFRDWLAADPFENPNVPAGPAGMPSYQNPQFEQAKRLNAQASADFLAGTDARETANRYVRATVLFASVLFFVAIAQRFKEKGVRVAANGIAVVLLVYTSVVVFSLPRI